jgi:hypothetical protein
MSNAVTRLPPPAPRPAAGRRRTPTANTRKPREQTRFAHVRPDQDIARRGDTPPPDALHVIDRIRGAHH